MGDGIAYCQILDAVWPGKVALSKLKYNARKLVHRYNKILC